MLYKKPDSPFWWADIRIAGTRHRISTKQEGKTLAKQVEAALIHQPSTGESIGVRNRAPYLREFAETFLVYVEKSRLEEETKKYYKGGWRLLRGQNIAGKRLDAVTTSDAAMLQIEGSGSNVNMALRTLKRMLSVAEEMQLLARTPRIRLAKERGRERLIFPHEEQLILAKARATLRDVFLLVFDTGMRPGEAVRLRWDNVDFVRGVILVTHGKTRQSRRHLPMSSRVLEMLKERAKLGSEWLFPSQRGGLHVEAKSVSDSFRILKRSLKLPEEMVLYSARHTFATDFMDETGDLSKTQKMLGHGNTKTVTRYLHPTVANFAAIMDTGNEKRHVLSHGPKSYTSVVA